MYVDCSALSILLIYSKILADIAAHGKGGSFQEAAAFASSSYWI